MPSPPNRRRRLISAPGVDAITLGPFIVYRRGIEHDLPLRCHEHFHWKQALRWGVVPWYLAYLMLKPFDLGSRTPRHSLEAQAYAVHREVAALLVAATESILAPHRDDVRRNVDLVLHAVAAAEGSA